MTRADEDAIADFRERFAQIMVESGMPRMAARLYAALLITESGRLSPSVSSSRLSRPGALERLCAMKLLRTLRDASDV